MRAKGRPSPLLVLPTGVPTSKVPRRDRRRAFSAVAPTTPELPTERNLLYAVIRHRKRKRAIAVFRAGLVVGAIAVSGATVPAAAFAAPYDNTDPMQTGCAASAQPVTSTMIYDSRGANLALIEMRWSTACQTNWTRMTSKQGGARWMRAYINRGSTWLTFAGTFSQIYTNQLYGGPGTSCLYSDGWARDPYTGNLNYARTGCY